MAVWKLYGLPGTVSMATHIALVEAGETVEWINVRAEIEGGPSGAAYRAINPRGKVPALVSPDGSMLTETLATILAISERFPETNLMPEDADSRAYAYEWLSWIMTGTYAAVRRFYYPHQALPEGEGAPDPAPVKERALSELKTAYAEIEAMLRDGGWAVGSDRSLVDILLLIFYRWGNRMGMSMEADFPKWTNLARELAAQPAVASVMAREGVALDGSS